MSRTIAYSEKLKLSRTSSDDKSSGSLPRKNRYFDEMKNIYIKNLHPLSYLYQSTHDHYCSQDY